MGRFQGFRTDALGQGLVNISERFFLKWLLGGVFIDLGIH